MAGAGIERLGEWLDRNRDGADEWDERWGDFVVLVGLAMAAAPRLRRADKRVDHLQMRALLSVEWVEQVRPGGACWHECPACRNDRRQLSKDGKGHGSACPIDAAMTAAGLPDQASRDAARAEFAKR